MAIYEYKTRIRYSEIGPDQKLTITSLLDLFQNCSTFQSEDLGIGVNYLKEKKHAWVLSSWQIVIDNLPSFPDEVTIQTWSYGIKMAIGQRNFQLLDKNGKSLVRANSLWVYLDTDKLLPDRCPKSESDLYGIDPQIDMEPMPRKITIPEDMTALTPFEVKYYHLDTNNHVNNAKYIQAAAEYLPADTSYRIIRAEYKKSALLHDIIYPAIKQESDKVTITLSDSDNNIYTTVQFVK